MYRNLGKRCLDLSVAVPALVIALPVLAVVGAAVWMSQGRPILFSQARGGRGGRPFTLGNFRTMGRRAAADGTELPDAQRITRFGRWLRRTSLDELPELLNVVRGDMSLVGPRPLLAEYLPRYAPWQARRHAVRPGITGWAQINLPYDGSVHDVRQKVAYDLQYIWRQSALEDLRIMARTVPVMLYGQGSR